MAIEITMNPALVEELRNAKELAPLLGAICQAIEEEAKADPHSASQSGRYRDSFGIDVSQQPPHGWIGTVYNTDFDAAWVEFGAHAGGKTPVLGYHILSRALDAVAGRGGDSLPDAEGE